MQTFGERLRTVRLEAGKTQDQVAKYLHVTRQTISSWENGRTQPNFTMLQQLAEAIGVDVSKFFERE